MMLRVKELTTVRSPKNKAKTNRKRNLSLDALRKIGRSCSRRGVSAMNSKTPASGICCDKRRVEESLFSNPPHRVKILYIQLLPCMPCTM